MDGVGVVVVMAMAMAIAYIDRPTDRLGLIMPSASRFALIAGMASSL